MYFPQQPPEHPQYNCSPTDGPLFSKPHSNNTRTCSDPLSIHMNHQPSDMRPPQTFLRLNMDSDLINMWESACSDFQHYSTSPHQRNESSSSPKYRKTKPTTNIESPLLNQVLQINKRRNALCHIKQNLTLSNLRDLLEQKAMKEKSKILVPILPIMHPHVSLWLKTPFKPDEKFIEGHIDSHLIGVSIQKEWLDSVRFQNKPLTLSVQLLGRCSSDLNHLFLIRELVELTRNVPKCGLYCIEATTIKEASHKHGGRLFLRYVLKCGEEEISSLNSEGFMTLRRR